MATKLVVWGTSGHALVVVDIVRLTGEYDIVGFLDDTSGRHQTEFCGAPVLGGREQLDPLCEAGHTHVVLAFGDCLARLQVAELVRAAGLQLATVVHPRAIIAGDVRLGEGTVAAAGAIVNPGTRVGANVILNTGSSVDHECDLGDGVHISPGVHLAGRVVVGRGTWIGIGAVVKEQIRIGDEAVIGAGAVVVRDIPSKVLAYGVPARVVGTR